MKRIISSLGLIAFVGALVVGGTGAFFSDTETSEANVFTAGALDLKIDSVSHYNGMICTLVGDNGYVWIPDEDVTLDDENQPVANDDMDEQANWDAFNEANPAQFPPAGVACTGTWPLDDIGEGQANLGTFFDFDDIKPGDEGENTISIHVDNNDAWMCVSLENIDEADNTQTEPEAEVDPDGLTSGELDENLFLFAWLDDGDNVYEPGEDIGNTGETEFAFGEPVAASELAAGTWTLADSNSANGPIVGGSTNYIGVYWCAGEIDTNGGAGPLSCDGEAMGNEAQTDSWSADLSFYIEQARNNPDFTCEPGDGGGLACNEENDVMFVLDSSGSIDVTELGQLKVAAKGFAAALSPSTPGNHIGVVDFDSTATLRSELTDVLADIDTAIDALISGGTTNMTAGITLATAELDSDRDRDDSTVPDFMLIMTDGEPESVNDATAAADAAKAAGITIFVVGIGDGVDDDFLEGIASSPANYFSSAEFADLEAVLDGLAECPLDDIQA